MIKIYLMFCQDYKVSDYFCKSKELEEYYKNNWDIYTCFDRKNGYFENKRLYHCINKERDLIIWTNDETMLGYAQEDLFNGREYGIDLFIQDTNKDDLTFINVLETYPNVRHSNNVLKMVMSGVFGGIPLPEKYLLSTEGNEEKQIIKENEFELDEMDWSCE